MSRKSKAHRLLWRTEADGPGVYVMRNLETGLIYIGATERPIPERIAEHCRSRKGTVQRLFSGTGRVEVTCDVIVSGDALKILQREREVGLKLSQKYPDHLVNYTHLLGKSPNKSIHDNKKNGKGAVSSPKNNNSKNSSIMHNREILAIMPDGTWQKFHGVRFAAAQLGLDNSTISKVLNGLRDHHEGIFFIDVPNAL